MVGFQGHFSISLGFARTSKFIRALPGILFPRARLDCLNRRFEVRPRYRPATLNHIEDRERDFGVLLFQWFWVIHRWGVFPPA